MTNKKTTKLVGILFLIFLFFFVVYKNGQTISFEETQDMTNTMWQDEYVSMASSEFVNYESLIANTDYYNYNNPMIVSISEDIALNSDSAKEAITNTLAYVYDNIEYITGESDDACFYGTAPSILESGEGQCDTQSIVVISLLRKMGIIAKPVGGCIVQNPTCKFQSLYTQSFQDIFKVPRFSSMDSVSNDQMTFSRGYSRKGGLHAFVTAWLPTDGWIVLESTAGKIADTECYYYHVEIFPEDDEREDLCVSKSWNYAYACMNNNIDELNEYGLGIMPEVHP